MILFQKQNQSCVKEYQLKTANNMKGNIVASAYQYDDV